MKEIIQASSKKISFNEFIHQHKTQLTLVDNPPQLVGTTSDQRKWKVILPINNSFTHVQSENTEKRLNNSSFNDFYDFCQKNHPALISSIHQDERHLSANAFIAANWSQIVPYCSLHSTGNPSESLFCIQEVNFFLPKNQDGRIMNFSIDCIASDYVKNIYVIEIGVRKRQKIKKSREQIEKLTQLYPHIRFIGLVAYYDFTHTPIKITLRM